MFSSSSKNDPIRCGLRVRGAVQGVGFRPAVHRLAAKWSVAGLVRNDAEGVWIEVEGDPATVERFAEAVAAVELPRARVESVERAQLEPTGQSGFWIAPSEESIEAGEAGESRAGARVPADVAPCADCTRELFDRRDRRHRYPFINCTACGPRYSIVAELPYDRARTTMSGFALCARCRREYEDPEDRRFHAEPNACPECGPRLRLLYQNDAGEPLGQNGADPLFAAVSALREGKIVAVKGVGGFLLAACARDEAAVVRLRERKCRPHKPFALLARDLTEVERVAQVSEVARRALVDPARPIVLLPARVGAGVAPSVAPGLGELGVMLPSSPLHQLLIAEGPPLLVLTSGNRRDEPLARDDADALAQLGTIADLFVTHDRAIHTRVDDSVVRVIAGEVTPLRRARGFAPDPLPLPIAGAPVLAVGGQLKSTVCLTRAGEAFVSQHLGDLAHPAAFAWFEETIAKLGRLLAVSPQLIAHDLHPEYRSTRWALARGPLIAVQHHHAHIAACLAEHGRTGPAIGVAFDGTGCGPDGELWGGEFLVADLGRFERLGHLRPLTLVGGEAAIRRPWRLALAALADAGLPVDRLARITSPARDTSPNARLDSARFASVTRLLATPLAGPRATGAGRWFDAASALLGLRDEITYDAQAAVELEAAATVDAVEPYPFSLDDARPFEVDLRPTVRALAVELDLGTRTCVIASRFHETFAHLIAAGARRARAFARTDTIALSGGCFGNARLTERARELLARDGFEVLLHRRVPPNDGGLSYGQAAIASFHSYRESSHVSRNSR